MSGVLGRLWLRLVPLRMWLLALGWLLAMAVLALQPEPPEPSGVEFSEEQWLELAEGGHPYAQFTAAAILIGRQEYARAIELLELAAEQDNAFAQYRLAFLYNEGAAVPKDSERVLYWLRRAAALGLYDAQYSLGVVYRQGDGVAADPVRSYMWLSIAAEQKVELSLQHRAELERELSAAQLAEAEVLIAACKQSEYQDC